MRRAFPLLPALVVAGLACRGASGPGAMPTLTTAAEIRALSAAEASRGYPVRLRGVVTSYGNEQYAYYLQDATGGVRVDPEAGRGHPNVVGESIEVIGTTASGPHAALVVQPRYTSAGGAPLPPARESTLARVARGDEAAQWVEVAGAVQSAALDNGLLVLQLAEGREVVRAEIIAFPDDTAPERLVGARVQARGVAADPPHPKAPGGLLYVPTLENVRVVAPAAATPPPGASGARTSVPSLPVLTRVEQIRELSVAEAAREHPVRLRAVVTFYNPPLLFVQDESAGIFVRSVTPQDVRWGQLVDLTGVTGPGQFAPIIDRPRLRAVGTATLPPARRVDIERLFTGAMDSQWVEVDGLTVRRIEGERLHVVSGYRQLEVWLPGQPPPALLNARIRIRGVANTFFNQSRQIVAVGLNVPDLRHLDVTAPAPDPAALAVTPIDHVLRFSPRTDMDRVRVQGTVLLSRGGRTLYIQDDTGGAEVQAADDVSGVQPGDRVDAMGFPATGGYAPLFQDAIVRTIGRAPLPAPRALTAAAVLSGQHDLEWVEIEARLLGETPSGDETVLTLESAQTVFIAHLQRPQPPALRRGSLLSLRGVTTLQLDPTRPENAAQQIRGFQMLVPSRADVVLLQSPPWLELKHVAFVAGLLALIGLLAHRLHLMKVKARFDAVSEERARMAREIHDTLQQRFVAVLMRLDPLALRKAGVSDAAREHIGETRTILRSCVSEAQRLVQDLRSPALERTGLADALGGIVRQLSAGGGPRIELKVVGTPRRLPDTTENNLLRIGQEALVNAIRHGHAMHVDVELCFEEGRVQLAITDDGRGFDSEHAVAEPGHYGVLGMRERAQQLRGEFQLQSRPGQGTAIRVAVPVRS
jgi:signal transduction histidine kinase